jgi:hypothetical protein
MQIETHAESFLESYITLYVETHAESFLKVTLHYRNPRGKFFGKLHYIIETHAESFLESYITLYVETHAEIFFESYITL